MQDLGKSNKVVIPTNFENSNIRIRNGFTDMSDNVWSFRKVKLSDFLRDYYKL